MQNAEHFFDFAAQVGLTKHLGGAGATEELLALCHIGPDSYVLDVGCGAGVTPAFIVHKFDCRVVGVDILEGMVQRSRERAAREGIAANTEFRVADAQDLPFDDEVFDAVITESVSAFPEDKQRAVDEYARVTRPGGYVGLNESTWLQVPPPPEMVDWVSQEVGAAVSPLTPEEWRALMEGADLRDIVVQVREISTQNELQGLLRRYGCRGMLGVWGRILALYARNPAYRQFVRQVQQRGVIPENLDDYFGYGLYVGRK